MGGGRCAACLWVGGLQMEQNVGGTGRWDRLFSPRAPGTASEALCLVSSGSHSQRPGKAGVYVCVNTRQVQWPGCGVGATAGLTQVCLCFAGGRGRAGGGGGGVPAGLQEAARPGRS